MLLVLSFIVKRRLSRRFLFGNEMVKQGRGFARSGRLRLRPYRPGIGVTSFLRNYAVPAVGAAVGNYAAKRFGYSQTQNGSSGHSVTGHYDKSFVYKKKRMPRFKKRRWRRFKRKVNAVIDKGIQPTNVLRNTQDLVTQAAALQSMLFFGLYTGKSNTNERYDDIYSVLTADTKVTEYTKVRFDTGVFDMTLTNLSTNTGATATCSIEVDIYHVRFFRQINNQAEGGTWEDLRDNASTSVPNNTTGFTHSDVGITPFQLPAMISKSKMNIIKKTKYFVPYGSSITYQIRDPKSHYIMIGEINNKNSWTIPKVTQGIIIVAKCVPMATETFAVQYKIGHTRLYKYSVLNAQGLYETLV